MTFCRLDRDADRRLAACAAEGRAGDGAATSPLTGTNGHVSLVGGEGSASESSGDVVRRQVDRELAHVSAPETELTYGVERDGKITARIQPEAADVTAYHDFHQLNIAFESLWTEIFDGALRAAGMSFYEEIVRREDWTMADHDGFIINRIKNVTDMRDLLKLYTSSRAAAGDAAPVPRLMYDLVRSPVLDYEPTDQRLFHLYNTEVDWFETADSEIRVRYEGGRAGVGFLPESPLFDVDITIPAEGHRRVKKNCRKWPTWTPFWDIRATT